MAGKQRLHKAYRNLDIQKLDDIAPIPAILGFLINGVPTVRVANRPGYVYVRFRDNLSEVCQAYNDTVSLVYNLPVLVIRDKTDKSRYRIQGRDLGRYENWATSTAYLPMHGSQHSFNPPDEGGDVVWIYSQQIMPLMGYPSGTTGGDNLFIKPYPRYNGSLWQYLGNTGSPSFMPYKPTGSSTSKLALLYADANGNPQIVANGAEFPSTGTALSAIFRFLPSLPDSYSVPIAAVRLSSGTSIIDWNNLYDVRQWLTPGYAPSSSPGGGGALAIFDNGVFKGSGTALSFDANLSVVVTGTTAFISSAGAGTIQGARVYRVTGTNQSVPNTTWTSISFNAESFDTDNIFDLSTGSSTRLTCQTAGVYALIGHVTWDSNVSSQRYLRVFHNNATVIVQDQRAAAAALILKVSTIYNLAQNDYIELQVYQDSGGVRTVDYYNDYSPIFAIQKIG